MKCLSMKCPNTRDSLTLFILEIEANVQNSFKVVPNQVHTILWFGSAAAKFLEILKICTDSDNLILIN